MNHFRVNHFRYHPVRPRLVRDITIVKEMCVRICITVGLLMMSNIFMTFAWYGHLGALKHKPWVVAALISWGIALFEYLIQVPANRIGHEVMNVGQLKILQEVITLAVFVPFAWVYLKEKPSLDYLWAGICLTGALFFVFRSKLMGG